MVQYLTVPYKDKDIVKALGARWDGVARQWFVPKGADENRFLRWIGPASATSPTKASQGAVPIQIPNAPTSVQTNSSSQVKGAPLSSILFEVSDSVRRALPHPRWIVAEVAAIKTHQGSGHTYFELVEHDGGGREIAKASARLWASSAKLLTRFEKVTGAPINVGMKIMLCATAEYSVQFGFGFIIQDIDPGWCLGEMELKKNEIRQELIQKGLFHLNKKIPPLKDCTNLLVLSPAGAAGLGDFKAEADKLSRLGLCQFKYYEAAFEGAGAALSICKQLDAIRDHLIQTPYDGLIIIRGGGAKTSLNWLNEFDIASRVCSFKLPVMTGIGHEQDSTLLDEVANEFFDTPSKVIENITGRIAHNALDALGEWEELHAIVQGWLAQSDLEIETQKNTIGLIAEQLAEKATIECAWLIQEAQADGARIIERAQQQIDAWMQETLGLGPGSVMARGYCVVENTAGTPIASAMQAQNEHKINLRFFDGKVTAELESDPKAVPTAKSLGPQKAKSRKKKGT